MPPSKRSSTKTSAGAAPRPKRGRSSAATSMAISNSVALPASDATSSSSSGTVSIDVAALSATVSAVVTEALKTTLSSETLTGILKNTGPSILLEPLALESSSSVGAVLTAEVADILQDGHASGTNRGGAPTTLNDSRTQSTFTSISVPLSSRVSGKLKAKIFANEYVDFGAFFSSSPNNEGKYDLREFMFQSHMRFCLTQWSATTFYGSLSVYSCPLHSEKKVYTSWWKATSAPVIYTLCSM